MYQHIKSEIVFLGVKCDTEDIYNDNLNCGSFHFLLINNAMVRNNLIIIIMIGGNSYFCPTYETSKLKFKMFTNLN